MEWMDALAEPALLLHNMRKAAEKGESIPAEDKRNVERGRWLRDNFNRKQLDSMYFFREYNNLPESIKKAVEGEQTIS